MRNSEEAIEEAESQCRQNTEIHGGDALAVVAQKGYPAFCGLRIPRSFSHPAKNRPLRDLKTKHLEFTMNPWRTPRLISVTLRKMRSRNSLLRHFLPSRI